MEFVGECWCRRHRPISLINLRKLVSPLPRKASKQCEKTHIRGPRWANRHPKRSDGCVNSNCPHGNFRLQEGAPSSHPQLISNQVLQLWVSVVPSLANKHALYALLLEIQQISSWFYKVVCKSIQDQDIINICARKYQDGFITKLQLHKGQRVKKPMLHGKMIHNCFTDFFLLLTLRRIDWISLGAKSSEMHNKVGR